MASTTYKIDRLVSALSRGHKLSTTQMVAKFGFATTNAARAAISDLRNIHGYKINTSKSRDGVTKYQLAA